MGLLDKIVKKVNIVTYQKVKNLSKDGDISGLVHCVEDADKNIMPHVLIALRDLVNKGQGELVVRLNIKERLESRNDLTGDVHFMRERALLYLILIKRGFGEQVLDDGIASELVTHLPGSDNELRKEITWTLPYLMNNGYDGSVTENIQINDLIHQLDIDDPDLQYYSTYIINILSDGYLEDELIRSGVVEKLKRLSQSIDIDISNYSGLAFRRLDKYISNKRRVGSIIGTPKRENNIQHDRECGLNDRITDEGYLRPIRKNKAKKGSVKTLRHDGTCLDIPDDDITIELKKGDRTISSDYVSGNIDEE